MSTRKREPVWFLLRVVVAIHDDLLAKFGGMPGLRDQGLFESALARPQNRWAYQDANDVFDCAASYGFGIAKNHAFNDGNKRTAFQSMYAFLLLNGARITATEEAVVELMIGVADDSVSEAALAVWLRENSSRLRVKRAPK